MSNIDDWLWYDGVCDISNARVVDLTYCDDISDDNHVGVCFTTKHHAGCYALHKSEFMYKGTYTYVFDVSETE